MSAAKGSDRRGDYLTMAHPEELPTLRMVTLRRLVARVARFHVIVLGESPLRDSPAVVVDGDGVFLGTLCFGEAEPRMTPVVLAEDDVDAARRAMREHDIDRVAVIDPTGDLLGVVTAADLER